MTNAEKHIEKLLSWYKEAVTEDGVCYLTCDDKNTLAYAIKCCKHFEDIKKDIDSWMLREEPSSSGKPNKSIEEKCPCYHCEYFEIKGWSHCKIHEDAYGDSRCNDYHKVSQDLTKVKQDSNKSEIPTSSDDCISRQDVLSEIIRFSTEEGASVECQQLYCDVNNMPSVTPQEPKTGHWIEVAKYSDGKHEIECSKCGSHIFDRGHANSYIVKEKYKYCPRCGAKMVKPHESEEV